jgi:tryptophan synthase alpha subunit
VIKTDEIYEMMYNIPIKNKINSIFKELKIVNENGMVLVNLERIEEKMIKKYISNYGISYVIEIWASLETPVEFPEMPRRKLLIIYYITNYINAIFSIG